VCPWEFFWKEKKKGGKKKELAKAVVERNVG
jgi:hypothetical protein